MWGTVCTARASSAAAVKTNSGGRRTIRAPRSGIKKKKMKIENKLVAKTFLAAVFALACMGSAIAGTDIKDGFVVKHQQVLLVVNGTTKVMSDDMKLRSGILVRTDGTVVVPGGDRTTLKEGDTMSFGGTITRGATGKVEQVTPSN
jgi:hypothetical protein